MSGAEKINREMILSSMGIPQNSDTGSGCGKQHTTCKSVIVYGKWHVCYCPHAKSLAVSVDGSDFCSQRATFLSRSCFSLEYTTSHVSWVKGRIPLEQHGGSEEVCSRRDGLVKITLSFLLQKSSMGSKPTFEKLWLGSVFPAYRLIAKYITHG